MTFLGEIISDIKYSFTKRGAINNATLELKFLKVLLPIFFLFLTTLSLPFITLIFAGSIGEDHLAGTGLGNTIFNVIMMAIPIGYSSVFDTYGPQVYGSKHRKELGTLVLKCCAQGFLVYLTILGPYLNIAHLLAIMPQESTHSNINEFNKLLDIDEGMSVQDIAIRYIRMACVLGFFDYLIALCSKYLAIQGAGHSKFVYVASFAQVTFHILYNFMTVSLCSLGVDGLALAAIMGRMSTIVILIAYCSIRKDHLILPVLSMKIFEDWKPMVKLGLSGSINLLSELALFEVASFLAQYNGVTTLATVVIAFQLMNMLYSVIMSMSYVTAMLVGEKLGEGDEAGAKTFTKVGIVNTFAESLLLVVLIYVFREYYAEIFTEKREVIDMFKSIAWLIMLQVPVDHFQTNVSRGALIAFGKQKFIAISLSIWSFVVGIPILFLMVFYTEMKAAGILVAFMVSAFLQSITVCIRLKYIDISKEIKKTKIRVGETDKSISKEKEEAVSTDDKENEEPSPIEVKEMEIAENGESEPTKTSTYDNIIRERKYILLIFFIISFFCAVLSALSFIKI